MAAKIGSIYVSLTADVSPYASAMSRAQTLTQRATGTIKKEVGVAERTIAGFNRTGLQFRPAALTAASRSFQLASDRVLALRGALLATTTVIGGFGAALATNAILRYADTFTSLQNQMRVVSNGSADLAARFKGVADVADRSRSSLQGTAILYSRLAKAAPTRSADEMLRVAETINKALQLGGATAQEAYSTAVQLSQGIASNRLGGEELRAILETPLGLELAKGLGVTIGQFREMGHAGELTADVILSGLNRIAGTIDQKFVQSVRTLDQALTQVDNRLIEYFGSANKAYGVTQGLAELVILFGDNLDSILPTIARASGLIASLFAGRLISGVGGNLFGGIKESAKEAKDRVIELSAAQSDLRKRTREAGLEANKARRAAEGDLSTFADKSVLNSYKREALKVQKLDEAKLNSQEALRSSYQRLATVTAQLPAQLTKLTDIQINSENKLNGLMRERQALHQKLTQAKTFETAALGMQATSTRPLEQVKDAAKARRTVELEMQAVEKEAVRERATLARTEAQIVNSIVAEDRKAASERIRLIREIEAEQTRAQRIDAARTQQLIASRGALTEAERNGAENVRQRVAETGAAYRDSAAQLRVVTTELTAAAAAATKLGQAKAFVGRQIASISALFGGPWGIALTAAIYLMGELSAKSRAAAVETDNALQILKKRLDEVAQAGGVGAAEARSRLLDEQIKALNSEREQLDVLVQNIRKEATSLAVTEGSVDPVLKETQRELLDLIDAFVKGKIAASDYVERVSAIGQANPILRDQANAALENTRQLQDVAIAMRQIVTEVDRLRNKAADPITIKINQVFDTVNAQPAIPGMRGQLDQKVRNEAFIRDINDQIDALEKGKGASDVYRKSQELIRKAKESNVSLTEEEINKYAAQLVKLEEVNRASGRMAKEFEKTKDILDKIAREGEGSFMSDLDREVIQRTKNIQGAEVAIRQYIAAVQSGNLSQAPKDLLAVRSALEQVAAADAYRDIINQWGSASQMAQEFTDKHRQLNLLVQEGKIGTYQAAAAWGEYITSFGEYQWVDDLASAIGSFASSAILDFENIGQAVDNLTKQLLNMVVQMAVVAPLQNMLKGFLGGAFVGAQTGSPMNLLGFTTPGVGHTGGMVPYGSGTNITGFPKAHSGMGPKEFLAILQRGESVLTNDHMQRTNATIAGLSNAAAKSGGGQVVQVFDQRKQGADIRQERTRGPNGEEVLRMFITDVQTDNIARGKTDAPQRARFGTQPRRR